MTGLAQTLQPNGVIAPMGKVSGGSRNTYVPSRNHVALFNVCTIEDPEGKHQQLLSA